MTIVTNSDRKAVYLRFSVFVPSIFVFWIWLYFFAWDYPNSLAVKSGPIMLVILAILPLFFVFNALRVIREPAQGDEIANNRTQRLRLFFAVCFLYAALHGAICLWIYIQYPVTNPEHTVGPEIWALFSLPPIFHSLAYYCRYVYAPKLDVH